ncbi:hypothetical protein HZB00_02710 [Candidatus Woesearchaeota archaeon]|nr:hypothetical protein [Candidatus Woesearchaeota archaeon]
MNIQSLIFETNIRRSFKLVKQDMLAVHSQVQRTRFDQANTKVLLQDLVKRIQTLEQQMLYPVKKIASRPISKNIFTKKVSKKKFIASKTGNKLHVKNCVFAKNILPKKRLYFASKIKPLNHGFKACECVKK